MNLNLPLYEFKSRNSSSGKKEIFDAFRKKYVILTPEEWVRQNFLRYLVEEKSYPSSLILVEKGLMVNRMQKRFDAVVYNNHGEAAALIEFKAPEVAISQSVFEQISSYNIKLRVKYLIVSNGLNHYCCRMDYEKNNFRFLKEIPTYAELF